VRRFPASLLRATAGVFHGDSLVPFLIGSTATAAGSVFDDDVADFIADPDHDFGQSLEDGAAPEVVGLAVAGVFTAGRFVETPRFRAMSYDLLDAFLVNWAYTSVVKVAVGRERPNGEDTKSFPSGHASNAFALAAVVERHYGWKGGVPAYALASAVAVSRLQRNKHYLSDVMAGATLGYLVGRTVVRVNGRPLEASRGPRVSVSPILGRRTRALSLAVAF
jgi:membrane-associated phospholipid phosphatase